MPGSLRPDAASAREDVSALLRALPKNNAYNEVFDASGAVRTHQQQLLGFIDKTPPEELERLRRQVRQRITEQEVTFNILGVPDGTNRPWHLDLLPVVVDPSEWVALETALSQRARLLNAVQADLLGGKRLLREGVIPAAALFEHPWYFRTCAEWAPIGGHRLTVYGVDLGRTSDGQYRVFSDRTAAPTGAGYALENRLVLGRTLSGLFNGYGVERVRRYFETLRRSVAELSPHSNEEPHVVLLSSGEQDESSFEHAYLARYLGYQLVEGRDLTVRDRTVYLKTLSGLRRVDVILRRVHDANCDPTSLREDSGQGVPGLVEAAASGNVGIANPLGFSLVEAPAIKAYLGAACRFLFGSDLLIPSVETLWCGEAQSLKQALSDMEGYVFKPAFAERHGEPAIPARMSSEKRLEFYERVKANPVNWVAERWPDLSLTPYYDRDSVKLGSVSLRTFLCRDGDDYMVMPGGLARMNAAPDGLFLSLGSEQASKDIWVPTRQHYANRPPPSMPDRGVDLKRGGVDLPSRLLDDIFWLGRYVERAEVIARLLRSGYDCLGTEAGEESQVALQAIVSALRRLEVLSPAEVPSGSAQRTLNGVLNDESGGSLRSVCNQIHQSTVRVRSHLSRDAWHTLKRLHIPFRNHNEASDTPTAYTELLIELLVTLAAVSGTMAENMVRGHGWTFLDMGRRVERGAMMLGVLQAMLPQGASRVHLETLLDIADSRLTYRARYLSKIQVAPVVDLVLTDDTNPRSVMFQVNQLCHHVQRLPKLGGQILSQAERRAIELQSKLLTVDVMAVCAGDGQLLRTLLEDSQTLIFQVSDDVTQHWLSHATQRRSQHSPKWVDADLEIR